ncbi:putative squalene monooxygenase-like, partial [Capsicum annuum]
ERVDHDLFYLELKSKEEIVFGGFSSNFTALFVQKWNLKSKSSREVAHVVEPAASNHLGGSSNQQTRNEKDHFCLEKSNDEDHIFRAFLHAALFSVVAFTSFGVVCFKPHLFVMLDMFELLTMVKKKSDMLVKANNKEVEIASDVEMDPGFWRDTMDLYFIQDKESRGLQQDNLIFFVNKIVQLFPSFTLLSGY